MTRTYRALSMFSIAVAMLAGCTETTFPEATGKGTINMINAMPASPSMGFLIEERFLGAVSYKAALGAQSFDDLSYNFNVQHTVFGNFQPTRVATQFIDMVADTDYTLVLTGSAAAPVITQWESPEREWEETETVFGATIAHLSPNLGDIDVYVGLTGTAPVLGEERAKLSFDERSPEIDLESEEYEIIITARDDPATILYQSYGTLFAARLSYTIAIFDTDPSITSNISVRSISRLGISVELPDSNSLPTLRTIHAAFGTGNIDIYRDEDFTAPIISNLGFAADTGDIPVLDGAVLYTYTAVGNPGTIIDEELQNVPRGLRVTSVLAGMQGSELLRIFEFDNRRSIESHAKLRIIQAAANIDRLDLYLVDRGTDITDVNPLISNLSFSISTDFAPTIAGNFDLILTLPDEKTVIAGPVALDLVNGDVVEALIMDTVDPMLVNVVVTRF